MWTPQTPTHMSAINGMSTYVEFCREFNFPRCKKAILTAAARVGSQRFFSLEICVSNNVRRWITIHTTFPPFSFSCMTHAGMKALILETHAESPL
jgi:hypothetical protein